MPICRHDQISGCNALIGFWLALLTMPTASFAMHVYTMAVVPQVTPVEIAQRWAPLLGRLEKETGESFQLRLTDRIPAFEKDFLAGLPDFVFLNPYHAVMAAKAQGYIPLVRGGEPLTGQLIVDRQGPYRKLADLAGKTIAFPAPNAFGASLYMRALLTEREQLAFTPVYVGTHQNVYRSVVKGEAAAGGGVESTLERESPALRSRLAVIYTTPGAPPHPLAAHPRVPKAVRDRVVAVILRLQADPEGRKLLASVDLGGAMPADYARDYAPLERLGLQRHAETVPR